MTIVPVTHRTWVADCGPMTRASAPLLGLLLLLAACQGSADASASVAASAAPSAAASASASSAPSVAASEPAPTEVPSPEPTEAPSPPASSGFGRGEFTVAPNPDADALFVARDSCRNPQDGYVLEFPGRWYTNTEIRDVPGCSWFAPTSFRAGDFDERPDEIAIEIFWIPGDRGFHGEIVSRQDGLVGGQYATRLLVAGTPDDPDDGTSYEYVVQLGPTPEAGPNLVARTDTSMGGDFDLNRAVLDRIMSTMEFVGSTQ